MGRIRKVRGLVGFGLVMLTAALPSCGRTELYPAPVEATRPGSGGGGLGAGMGGSSMGGTGLGAGGVGAGGLGAGGLGGSSAGTGGSLPEVQSIPIVASPLEKVDILFVIDNSISMADKQELFRTGVPSLVERVINPVCVSLTNAEDVVLPEGPNADCEPGYAREFAPLADVHVGIISSSLGGHGAVRCSTAAMGFRASQDDRAHLMPSVRADLDSYQGLGFLAWDPNLKATPPGETDFDALLADFREHVLAPGEDGCGYESTLEAWYRFLVEPNPPLEVVRNGDLAGPSRNADGSVLVDDLLLAQRAAFLRPDSVVVIVMMSDENDCSVVDHGVGWLTANEARLARGTTTCNIAPNDVCCRHCGLALATPTGCRPLEQDPNCQAGPHTADTDNLSLRCYNQKLRFGIDLLYPVARYIDGLTQPLVVDLNNCDGATGECPFVENPLFISGDQVRSAPSVMVTGIVGVPWQDIVEPSSLQGGLIRYLDAASLRKQGRWSVILGDPDNYVLPTDPLMHETPFERTGRNPITGDAIAPSSSTHPRANPANGHEFLIPGLNDLQYACTFPLPVPRDCSLETGACDCRPQDVSFNRPLCNPPDGGPAGLIQYFGKAYPGIRHLQVLEGLGTRGNLASICPRRSDGDPSHPDFGYNPAVDAITRQIASGLGSSCLPDPLDADVTSTLGCRVLEVSAAGCDCGAPGRRALSASQEALVDAELMALCQRRGNRRCGDYCACEVTPLSGAALAQCENENDPQQGDGWCYIDPENGVGESTLVNHCPGAAPRVIRVVGAPTQPNQELRLFCAD